MDTESNQVSHERLQGKNAHCQLWPSMSINNSSMYTTFSASIAAMENRRRKGSLVIDGQPGFAFPRKMTCITLAAILLHVMASGGDTRGSGGGGESQKMIHRRLQLFRNRDVVIGSKWAKGENTEKEIPKKT